MSRHAKTEDETSLKALCVLIKTIRLYKKSRLLTGFHYMSFEENYFKLTVKL
jgi:hypothetical protein